jgi:hypothetical protein
MCIDEEEGSGRRDRQVPSPDRMDSFSLTPPGTSKICCTGVHSSMSSADSPQRGEAATVCTYTPYNVVEVVQKGDGRGRAPGLALDHVLKVMVSPSAIRNDDALERIYVLASQKRHLKECCGDPSILSPNGKVCASRIGGSTFRQSPQPEPNRQVASIVHGERWSNGKKLGNRNW